MALLEYPLAQKVHKIFERRGYKRRTLSKATKVQKKNQAYIFLDILPIIAIKIV